MRAGDEAVGFVQIPAEFVGTPGLLSSVITKTGTNRFAGSVNYFFQNDNLVAENQNSPAENFSTFDVAATLGGPIVRDKAWFFGSIRRVEREDDGTSLDTRQLLRGVKLRPGSDAPAASPPASRAASAS